MEPLAVGLDLDLGLGNNIAIVLGLAHLDQFQAIGQLGLHGTQAGDGIIQAGAFAHEFLRPASIIPQAGIFDQFIQFIKAL